MVKIFIGRIPEDMKKGELAKMFAEFGDVIDCSIIKGYGFVHMADKEEAQKAIT